MMFGFSAARAASGASKMEKRRRGMMGEGAFKERSK
jgi:hypothetical protein